jgi:plasmid maintenance system antidote protein VapI
MPKAKRVVAEAFHPAEYIIQELEARKLTQVDFYHAFMEMGISMHYMMDVLTETRPVNDIVAIGLSRYFGTRRKIWLDLQKAYDEHPTIKQEAPDVPK